MGVQGVLDVPIYGRIAVMELFRPPVSLAKLLGGGFDCYNLVTGLAC